MFDISHILDGFLKKHEMFPVDFPRKNNRLHDSLSFTSLSSRLEKLINY
ncbi:hypothetical protein EMIT091MI3_10270 [Kosakonia quasisacchari]